MAAMSTPYCDHNRFSLNAYILIAGTCQVNMTGNGLVTFLLNAEVPSDHFQKGKPSTSCIFQFLGFCGIWGDEKLDKGTRRYSSACISVMMWVKVVLCTGRYTLITAVVFKAISYNILQQPASVYEAGHLKIS